MQAIPLAALFLMFALPSVARNLEWHGDIGMTTANNPFDLPFTVTSPQGEYTFASVYFSVKSNGQVLQGCDRKPLFYADAEFPPYVATTYCALPPQEPGWHVFDRVYDAADGSAPVARPFKLYVSSTPLTASMQLQPSPYSGYVSVVVRGPNPPPDPDGGELAPILADPPGTVTAESDGRPATCGHDFHRPGAYTCHIPQTRGRHRIVVRFHPSVAGSYPDLVDSFDYAFGNAAYTFNGDALADILWKSTAGRSAYWTMNGATQIGGGIIFPDGSGWSPRFARGNQGVFTKADGSAIVWQKGPASGSATIPLASGWTPKLFEAFEYCCISVVMEHADGRVSMFTEDSYTFGPISENPLVQQTGSGWHPVLAADFDRNIGPDILWQNDSGEVAMWLMDGHHQVGGARLIAPGTGWVPAFASDLDGDEKADIVWTHPDGRVAAWLMDGTRQVGGAALLPAGSGWKPIVVADIDGDRRADIVFERADGRTAYWTMNGTAQKGGGVIFAEGSGWKLLRIADFNGDGYGDYLAQHMDGRVAVGIFDGTSFTQAVILPAGSGYTPVAVPE